MHGILCKLILLFGVRDLLSLRTSQSWVQADKVIVHVNADGLGIDATMYARVSPR